MNHTSPAPICKDSNTILSLFCSEMARLGLDFWLQPLADEFQSEYPPPCAQRLAALSGFTGSAGMAIVRRDGKKHALFVDGRYTLQAANEVDVTQFDCINSGEIRLTEWLVNTVKTQATIGFDPWLSTHQELERWQHATANLPLRWQAISPNPVDRIWNTRPAPPEGEITLHPLALAGASYKQKRDILLDAMRAQRADAIILSLPDGINWLLNIRGSDVPYNPLLLCYFVLRADGTGTLYSYPHDFSAELRSYWAAEVINWQDIRDVFTAKDALFSANMRVMLDPSCSAHGFWQSAARDGWVIIPQDDPTLLPKACKNAKELAGMVAAHQIDGLAVTRFLHWLDTRFYEGKFCDELTIVAKLEEFRRNSPQYLGGSFPTIAGAGEHGAIVHYRANARSNRTTRAGELLLLDSGGQYHAGTTDITRTVFVPAPKGGKPTAAMVEHFTRVLKGHIAIASAQFPQGTTGAQLDVLARQFLWQAGLDYDHGTGHGVGAYLCVHEGPQRISKRGSSVALKEGMILSNEPGVYLPGHYGIRIENLVAVIRLPCEHESPQFLGFETITLAPIDTRLIDVVMLTSQERNWLNAYHQRVYKSFASALDTDALRWLGNATRAI